MFTVKTYHSDVLKAIIPVVKSLNAYYFLICTFSYLQMYHLLIPPIYYYSHYSSWSILYGRVFRDRRRLTTVSDLHNRNHFASARYHNHTFLSWDILTSASPNLYFIPSIGHTSVQKLRGGEGGVLFLLDKRVKPLVHWVSNRNSFRNTLLY